MAADPTRDPSLSELAGKLTGLRELIDERDTRYTERAVADAKAVDAALKAAERLTSTIHEASQKAIEKADINAEKWRANANEWRGAMQDRESRFATKPEVESEFKSIRAELVLLRETRSEGVGGKAAKDDNRANLAVIISLIGLVTLLVINFFKKG